MLQLANIGTGYFALKLILAKNCVFITFAEYLYGIFLPNISTHYLYVWKYSPRILRGDRSDQLAI